MSDKFGIIETLQHFACVFKCVCLCVSGWQTYKHSNGLFEAMKPTLRICVVVFHPNTFSGSSDESGSDVEKPTTDLTPDRVRELR